MDFILVRGDRLLPIEVKAGALSAPAVSRGFRSFLETDQPSEALLLNRSLLSEMQIGKTRVRVVPFPLFFLSPQTFIVS